MRHIRLGWLFLLVACGGDDAAGDDTGGTNPPASGDCADADYNPLAGTCAETFLADCFDPVGTCDGTFDMMGNGTLTWESGATVETSVDLTNMTSPVALTELVSSTGEVCATGRSENNVGGCASQTVYTRPDGATQTWCFQNDGSYALTCDDGSTLAISSAQAGAAEQCQYGSEAGPCEVEMEGMGR